MAKIISIWHGEFGWQVAVWVPILRALSKRFPEQVVCCKPQYRYLYQDFCREFEDIDYKGKEDRWFLDGKEPKISRELREKYNAIPWTPSLKTMYKKEKKFFKYGELDNKLKFDIVIHARAETRYGSENRNYPISRFEKIVKQFPDKRICSIGTKASHIEGTEDMRGIPLEKLCNILSSSKVCIGPSSGPMHLASLCHCPHIVFTDDKYQRSIAGTNKDRYEKVWNPFETPCKVLDNDNWKPSIKKVLSTMERFL
jgi:ADP-heptose:LPS heptosyltransferase